MQWPRGRVLGGSSSINGLLYIRGQPQDYDQWRQMGNAGWGYDDVLPYFKRSEDQERGADAFHGTGGPLGISDLRFQLPLCDAVIDAAAELGIPRRRDFNGKDQEGAGYFQLTARNGLRCSTAAAFLRPARSRRNLEVRPHALAERLVIEEGRAVGLRYTAKGGPCEARCRREIVLSAGAIGTPQLLMASGVGPGAELRDLGLEVLHDLPGVGANLQDHLQIRMVYKTREPITLNDRLRNPFGKAMMALEYALRRSGPLAMGASQVCIFARTDKGLETPDIQYHVQPWSPDSPGEGTHRFSAFTMSVCQLRPESRGRIRLKSRAVADAPAIEPNYLSTETDRRVAIESIKFTRRLINSRALSPLVSAEFRHGPAARSDEEILEGAKRISQTIHHPGGTCRMGADPMAVVDARLRLHGLGGLRVADPSIMPTIPSGNTNAPTIMIAEKAADLIRGDAGTA